MTYLGVDIGGTKTLVASLDSNGVIQKQLKFVTPREYKDFLKELELSIAKLTTKEFIAAGVGVPAILNRQDGIAITFGNLTWKNIPIQADVERIVQCPVVIENDAQLAGLSEAMLLKNKYHKVLYLTISTGIGVGVTVNGTIDVGLADTEAGFMTIKHEGKFQKWEKFASGKAIAKQFGKPARDIHDAKSWRSIASNLALGMSNLIAIVQPDVIVIGGGVGQYLKRFEKPLRSALKTYENPMVIIPPIREAARPEEAVIYGCYDLAKAIYGRFYT